MVTHIMWFRKDLRLEDNTAFYHALESLHSTDELLCLFHLDSKLYKIGTASHDYFFSALNHFLKTAKQKQVTIHLLSGNLIDSFETLQTTFPNWQHLYYNSDNRGYGQKRDLSVNAFLEAKGIHIHAFEEHHLMKAESIKKADGTAYKKFTPYYKKWLSLPKPAYRKLDISQYSAQLADKSDLFLEGETELKRLLNLRQTDFASSVGETAAQNRLNQFILTSLQHYDKNRDYPSIDGTSQLSHFLTTGEISIRKVYQAIQQTGYSLGKETFIKELVWRDFYHMIYHENPNQYQQELIEKYRKLPWQENNDWLTLWQNGQTGYPIIDAAMRQLNETGWMHNRLRMLTASFLTKDLLIDWRHGERYFSKQLIDYDAASNIGGWQWAASTGTDAVPYFRIFNPTTQSKKFDPEGTFIKTYLPELEKIPIKYIHEPNQLPVDLQKELNFTLGKDYPEPIVAHDKARKKALAFYALDKEV